MKPTFISNFIFNFTKNQKYFFCFYTFDMIKSNGLAINYIQTNLPFSLIIAWQCVLNTAIIRERFIILGQGQ